MTTERKILLLTSAIFVVFALAIGIYFKKERIKQIESDFSRIDYLEAKIDSIEKVAAKQLTKIDSLNKKKNEVIIKYKPIVFVIPTDSQRQANIQRFFRSSF